MTGMIKVIKILILILVVFTITSCETSKTEKEKQPTLTNIPHIVKGLEALGNSLSNNSTVDKNEKK